MNTRYLGWGIGFFDMDNDGWLDLLVANGHVYPEVNSVKTEAQYAEHKYLYRNLRNGRFEDVSALGGSGMTAAVPARGFALGDYDNDGRLDVVVNCVNSLPQLLHCKSALQHHWIRFRLVGVKSNRSGIGAQVRVVAKVQPDQPKPMLLLDEVRSGGGYYSQSDLRLHFGLGEAELAESVEVRWPSGQVDSYKDLAVDRLYVLEEGGKAPQAYLLPDIKKV